MTLLQAIIMGIVQGLTEFLPVSSSGHLVLASAIYKYSTGIPLASGGSEEVFFDIMLHVSTLIAVLIYFKDDLIKIHKAFFDAIKNKSFKDNEAAKLPLYLAIGTIATVAVVFPLKDYFEADMHKPAIVGIQIAITGILLFVTEFISQRKKTKGTKVNWKNSILIGIAQGIAVSPGISRSGATIAGGLFVGMDRVEAARYSFLLSIPIIILAALHHSYELFKAGAAFNFNWLAILIGSIFAGVIGFYSIKYFILFLSKYKLTGFAIYCLIVGIGMYLFFGYCV